MQQKGFKGFGGNWEHAGRSGIKVDYGWVVLSWNAEEGGRKRGVSGAMGWIDKRGEDDG